MDPLVQENIETATETAAIVAIPQHMVQPEPQPHLAEKDISPMKESIMRADSNASEGIIIDSTALLPRNTVVRIAGNNRTKASLIGLQATVRRSIGLGGWHWLVLPDGSEIKLQRNALTVLEYPTGLEAESSASEGERHKPVTPLAFAATNTTSSAALRPGELPLDFRMPIKRARPSTPVAGDFQDVRRTSLRQQQQHAAAASTLYFEPHVNLGKLHNTTLRRYLSVYAVSSAGPSRADMLDAAQRHFSNVEVTEDDVVRRFVEAAKRYGASATTVANF